MFFKILYLSVTFCAILHFAVADKESLVKDAKQTIGDKISQGKSPEPLDIEKFSSEKLSNKGHILFFHNAGTRSHLIAMSALMEGLLDHGHKVTAVVYAKSKIVDRNYKEILIEDK